jgi:hypothetical protein
MPEAAKPKPPEPSPLGFVHTAGEQEDHLPAAVALAEKLGWKGEPDWITNDIAVSDAVGFLNKVLHEHFIEGAHAHPLPAPQPVFDHLGIVDTAEQSLIASALASAHSSGSGTKLVAHPIKIGDMGRAFQAPKPEVNPIPGGKAGN